MIISDLLTVVVCSYERPKELTESMEFLRHFGLRAIIVDGSKVSLNRENINLGDKSKVIYKHLPTPSLIQRLGFAATLVQTPYTILMFDDEYLIPSALQAAINFLENNPKYVSCGGEAIGFSSYRGNIHWGEVYPRLRGFDLNEEEPGKRITSHLAEYRIASYCSVVRSALWCSAWKDISGHQFQPYGIQELQFESVLSWAGKLKILPEVLWLRNLKVPSIKNVGVVGLNDNLPFETWWRLDSNAPEKQLFLNKLANTLRLTSPSLQSTLENRELVSKIEEGFSLYSKYWIKKNQKVRQFAIQLSRTLSFSRIPNSHKEAENELDSLEGLVSKEATIDTNAMAEISKRIRLYSKSDNNVTGP